ncbi:MAG TPA: hypothetical protein VLO11_12585 [Luteolibacter sp.]|nr:hypothetical protein [Luteolibacter sp.]
MVWFMASWGWIRPHIDPVSNRMASGKCSKEQFHPNITNAFQRPRHPGNVPAADFTGDSHAFHHPNTRPGEGRAVMKPNTTQDTIVIPVGIGRLKLWTRRALETAGWLICLGLLAASAAVAGGAALVWLVSGSETLLAFGLAGGLVLGLAGVWHLLHRLDRTARQLR